MRRQFRELLLIANKERKTVPFALNEHQSTYFGAATNRDIILKSRQLGFSTGILGWKFLKCISQRNTRAVVISHDHKSTETLFNHVHFFTKHCKIPVETGHASKHELTFPATDSIFYVGTAGSREFGRGDTITDLHCSEFAFWPNPEQIVRGLFQAVPKDGSIIIESTANGQGNSFHRRCLKAMKKEGSTWKLHFYPWYIAKEYQIKAPRKFKLNAEEREYVKTVLEFTGVELSDSQVLWRRQKLEEFGEERTMGISPERFFDQEYPYSPESSFLVSGVGIFSQLGISPLPTDVRPTPPFSVYEEPKPGERYVIGADPAEGLMQDESVAEICKAGMPPVQVAEYASDTIRPDEFAYKLAEMGHKYNGALIVVERNNHGVATLSHLKKIYPYGLIWKETRLGKADYYDEATEQLGIRTTSNKAKMIDDLYMTLRDGFKYYSTLLHDELMSFVETRNQNGNVVLKAQSGCMDNRVMAMAMAVQGLLSYYRHVEENTPRVVPYNSPIGIRDRLRKRKSQSPNLVDSYFEERYGRI